MNTQLSHNDPDLRLARKIGSLTDSGLPLAEELRGEATWLDTLIDYKTDQLIEYNSGQRNTYNSDQPVTKSGLTWDELKNSLHTLPGSGVETAPSIYTLRFWMAAAAVLLLALFIGIYLYTTSPTGPVLVESAGSQVEFTAPDGSRITLRPYSSVRELASHEGLLAYAVEGEAYFEVVHNPAREFRVETGSASVTVLGTRFTAGNIGGTSRVYLQNGSVRLTSQVSSESVILEPGFSAAVDADGNLLQPRPVTTEEAVGWLYEQLNFTARPAGEIITELQHHFNIRIAIPARMTTDTISGRILLDDAARALEDAGIALGGRFEKRNDGSYVFIND